MVVGVTSAKKKRRKVRRWVRLFLE